MPYLSNRAQLIRDVEAIIRMNAMYMSIALPRVTEQLKQRNSDLLRMLYMLLQTRYISPPTNIAKSTHFRELLYALPDDEFRQETRMGKSTFIQVHSLIEGHPIFHNSSTNSQVPVEIQMAVAFSRLGAYGNGASVGRIARSHGAGCGTVVLYTKRYE